MQLQWSKKPCQFLQTHLRQVQPLEQTMEVRLGEELPDIGRILCAWGQPVIRSKEWRADGMNVSGGISASILYLPEDGSGPKKVEAWIPIQGKWSFSQTRREGNMRIKCCLRGIEARTISARKMMIRANVSLLGEALEPTEVDIYMPDEIPEGVELLKNVYPVVLPREAGEKQFIVEEELQVPNAEKWLGFTVTPELTEKTVVGNRLIMRGNGLLHYVYVDEQGMVHSAEQQLPFAQFADLDRDYDKEATADVMLCLSSLEAEVTDRGVRLQCGMMAQYVIWDRILLELAEDAYSSKYDIATTEEPVTLPVELDNRSQMVDASCFYRDGRLIDLVFLPDHPTTYREGDMVHLNLSGVFQCLYLDGEGNMQTDTENWNDELAIAVADGGQLLASIEGTEIHGTNAKLKINLQTCSNQQMNMISGISVGGARQTDPHAPTLILRRMDSGSLWELAKATGSTVSDIRKANHLVEEPQEGQLLLIPVS